MKTVLIALILLVGCTGNNDSKHVDAMKRGCVLKERTIVDRSCGRYGNCSDVMGSVYSCPAYEIKIRDW